MSSPYSFSIRPVFVYGALRSGTTLLRLMLDAHPGISHPGEMDCLFDHLHPDPTQPTGWRYDRTSMPLDRMFRATGLTLHEDVDGLDLLDAFLAELAGRAPGVPMISIHRNIARVACLMPQVKVIHLMRDPRDVAASSLRMGWAGTGWHAAEHWYQTEASWDTVASILSPDQVVNLRFEDMLNDLEGQLSRLCSFVGVVYNPVMLEYHKVSTYDPPNPDLSYQWRKRTPRMDIGLVEARLGTLMDARGYTPSCPLTSPGRLRLLGLGLRNKWHIWRVGMVRYGASLFLGEKFSRWLRLRRLHQRLKLRIDARTSEMLK